MAKIVINRCYGGFSLSHAAVMEYARRKGLTLYSRGSSLFEYATVPFDEYDRVLAEDRARPAGPGRFAASNALYFNDRGIERTDPVLVSVVDDLGSDANGSCADLQVVDVPDEVEWQIDEYDGFEWVAEKHRVWP